MVGKTISHYKILEKLGEGGMGTVYKARDTKLERTVALKFLPTELTRNPKAKQRFMQEAQAASALDHPNIGVIHEVDEREDGRLFIAMAYYPGQTLQDKIEEGAIPFDQAIDLTIQIAQGLAEAHAKEIVHRDIKPANIMITKKGEVKIVDFGLAKLAGRKRLTKSGATLGTVAYMSPEQAEGISVDHRTDVWSLAVVLYELITAEQPFKGKHEMAVLHSIMYDELDAASSLRAQMPAGMQRILEKGMARNPDERYQHVQDMLLDLKALKAAHKRVSKRLLTSLLRASRGKRRRIWNVAAPIIALFVGAAVWEWLRPTSSTPNPVARFVVPLPEDGRWAANMGAPPMALSPDGRHLVYVARNENGQQLYLRPLDGLQVKPLSGTEGAYTPFFSPDGLWVGFFAEGVLKKVRIAGGTPVQITDAPGWQLGATWGPEDLIVFAFRGKTGLWQVSAQGGKLEALTTPDFDSQERSHRFPSFLPDGKTLLFVVIDRRVSIWTFSLQTGEKRFITYGSSPHYLPTGHLVYVHLGSLHAARFDPTRLELTGPPVPLFAGISGGWGAGNDFAVSNNGSLAYFTASGNDRQMILVEPKGRERIIGDEVRNFSRPRFSPDGRRLAVQIAEHAGLEFDFWVYEFDQGTMSRLTFHQLTSRAEWTPDGRRLSISANLGVGTFDIYAVAADFSGKMDTLVTSEYDLYLGSWSRDSQWLVFTRDDPETNRDIWAVDFGESRTPKPLVHTEYNEDFPKLSPDGQWLAYTSDESGRREVYVRALRGSAGRKQISVAGAVMPVWSPDGQMLYYRQENKIISAVFEIDSDVKVLTRTVLIERNDLAFTDYDVHPNGKQFVVIKQVEDSGPELIVVQNWREELGHLVPSER